MTDSASNKASPQTRYSLRRIVIALLLLGASVTVVWRLSLQSKEPAAELDSLSLTRENAGQSNEDSAARDAVLQAAGGGNPRVMLPADVALVPGVSTVLADSWDELLNNLSADEQARVKVLSDRYPSAFTFTTKEQQLWMIERGFPMPEEILMADKIGADKLVDMALQGNAKAGTLAADMTLRALEDLSAPEGYNDDPRTVRMYQTLLSTRSSCSVFGMYVYARHFEASSRGRQGGQMEDTLVSSLAAYQAATQMGDRRAEQYVQSMGSSLINSWGAARAFAISTHALQPVGPPNGRGCPRESFPRAN